MQNYFGHLLIITITKNYRYIVINVCKLIFLLKTLFKIFLTFCIEKVKMGV